MDKLNRYSTVFLRLALGSAFLSAVADRFGIWGTAGESQVAWGDFAHFVAYTAQLNWFVPRGLIPAVAWVATALEIALGLALILGLYTRVVAFSSGILLLLFAMAMTTALGIKAPLDFSVFSASAGSFLLSTQPSYIWSLDSVRGRAATNDSS